MISICAKPFLQGPSKMIFLPCNLRQCLITQKKVASQSQSTKRLLQLEQKKILLFHCQLQLPSKHQFLFGNYHALLSLIYAVTFYLFCCFIVKVHGKHITRADFFLSSQNHAITFIATEVDAAPCFMWVGKYYPIEAHQLAVLCYKSIKVSKTRDKATT